MSIKSFLRRMLAVKSTESKPAETPTARFTQDNTFVSSDGITVKIVEKTNPERHLEFELTLGVALEVVSENGEITICLDMNKVALLAQNQLAHDYVHMAEPNLIKSTIITLCAGTSLFVSKSDKPFFKLDAAEVQDMLLPTTKPTLVN
jgi:hypothetical protein